MKTSVTITVIAVSVLWCSSAGAASVSSVTQADQPVLAEQFSTNQTCRNNCRLNIMLPADTDQPPMADFMLRFADPSGQLMVEVNNQSRGNGATVLRFQDRDSTPFINRGGAPMVTVPVNPGQNVLNVRPFEDGVCLAPAGCKYDVINTGQPDRPILDPVIIIDPVD